MGDFMKKEEMMRILRHKYGYAEVDLESKTYAELRKILSYERLNEPDFNDEADLFPNGRYFDEEDEDF